MVRVGNQSCPLHSVTRGQCWNPRECRYFPFTGISAVPLDCFEKLQGLQTLLQPKEKIHLSFNCMKWEICTKNPTVQHTFKKEIYSAKGTTTTAHPVGPWVYPEHTCICLLEKIRTECFALLILLKTPCRKLSIEQARSDKPKASSWIPLL